VSQPGHDLQHVDAGRVVRRSEPGDDDSWADNDGHLKSRAASAALPPSRNSRLSGIRSFSGRAEVSKTGLLERRERDRARAGEAYGTPTLAVVLTSIFFCTTFSDERLWVMWTIVPVDLRRCQSDLRLLDD